MNLKKSACLKSLTSGVSALALLALSGGMEAAFAARCVTGIDTTSENVVKDIDVQSGTAITDVGLNKTTVDVVDSVDQTKNPPITLGPITIIPGGLVVTNVSSTTTPVLQDATLTTTSGSFVTSVTPTFVPVITSVTPTFSGANDSGSTGSFGCGQGADVSNSFGATAVGPFASASQALLSSAFGAGAQADNSAFSSAFGALANASNSIGSTATGAGANVEFSALSTATGAGAISVLSIGSTATGAGANTSLSIGSTATGAGSSAVFSVGSTATGAQANANFSLGSTATGAYSDVSGTAFATANGFGSEVQQGTIGGTAGGAFSYAGANGASAYGVGSSATGEGATAVGAGASASAEGSTALGAGATTSTPYEMKLGTAANTYTAPGITSDLSRDRQSGPLEVVTSDGNGHLASDGGQIFRELGKQGAGIAIATALENPDLVANETFGLAANVGFFEGNSALAVSAMGVLGHDFAGGGERWAISGGVGVSLNENNFGGQSTDRTVAGRAGVQVTW